MAITHVEEIWNGRDAKRDKENKRTYMRTWRVRSDDASESALAVRDAAGIPDFGDAYSVGTDLDSAATVIDKQARQGTEDRKVWYVEVSYSTEEPGDGGGEDGSGNPTSDPVSFASKIRSQLAQFTGKIYKQAEDPFAGEPTKAWLGKDKAFLNSAMQPYRPPYREVDRSDLVITITRYQAAFNADIANHYRDAVNSEDWGIAYRGFVATCPKGTAKMQNISCNDFERINNIEVRQVTYEIHVREDGWHDEVLDEGTTIGAISPVSSWPGNVARINAIVDENGQPVPQPVLLKDGQPLPPGHDPEYIRWHVYKRFNFNALGLP